jgi:hypothetical protein
MSQELDTSLIGETAAQLMESLPDEADGEIVAVGIIVVVDAGDRVYTKVKTIPERYYEQLGILYAGLHVLMATTTSRYEPAMAKKAYELKANLASGARLVATVDGAGKQVEIGEGDTYETSSLEEQQVLDAVDELKAAEPKKGGDK